MISLGRGLSVDGPGHQARILFLHRAGQDQVAPADPGKNLLALFRGPVPGDGQGGNHRAVEGDRGYDPSHFLQNHSQVGQGKALAAVLLGPSCRATITSTSALMPGLSPCKEGS